MRLQSVRRIMLACTGIAVFVVAGGCKPMDRLQVNDALVATPIVEPGEFVVEVDASTSFFLGDAPTKAQRLSGGKRVPVGPELDAAAGVDSRTPTETLGRGMSQSVVTTFGAGPTAGKRYHLLYGGDLEVTGRAYPTSEAAADSIAEGLDLTVPGVFSRVEVAGHQGIAFSAGSSRSTVTVTGTVPGFHSESGCVIWSDGPAVYSVSLTGGSKDQVMRVAKSMYR